MVTPCSHSVVQHFFWNPLCHHQTLAKRIFNIVWPILIACAAGVLYRLCRRPRCPGNSVELIREARQFATSLIDNTIPPYVFRKSDDGNYRIAQPNAEIGRLVARYITYITQIESTLSNETLWTDEEIQPALFETMQIISCLVFKILDDLPTFLQQLEKMVWVALQQLL